MDNLYDAMIQERKILEQLIRKTRAEIRNGPKGTLEISYSHDSVQYYHKTKNRRYYLRKEQLPLACQLAQVSYDKKVERIAKRRQEDLELFLHAHPYDEILQCYEQLSPDRKALVHPVEEPFHAYAMRWKAVPYQGKSFYSDSTVILTRNGERVRSRIEKMIADELRRYGLTYRYEYPVRLPGVGIVYPDFTILHPKSRNEILWEHFGLMGDRPYAEKALQKLSAYQKSGYFPGDRLIVTFEDGKTRMGTEQIDAVIEHFSNNNTDPAETGSVVHLWISRPGPSPLR